MRYMVINKVLPFLDKIIQENKIENNNFFVIYLVELLQLGTILNKKIFLFTQMII